MRHRFLLLGLLFCATSFSLAAQTTEDEARDDLDYYSDRQPATRGDDLGGRIWWGTGAQLQFQGGNQSSFFLIGISPIAGYKVNNFLSFGPRGSVAYNAYRFEDFAGNVDKFKFLTWSGGLFGRVKVFRQFFVHSEYSLVNEVINFDGNGDANRRTRAIPFLGGGLQQGGGPGQTGFEIMLLFRLSQADQIGDAPYEIRSGINFNF